MCWIYWAQTSKRLFEKKTLDSKRYKKLRAIPTGPIRWAHTGISCMNNFHIHTIFVYFCMVQVTCDTNILYDFVGRNVSFSGFSLGCIANKHVALYNTWGWCEKSPGAFSASWCDPLPLPCGGLHRGQKSKETTSS